MLGVQSLEPGFKKFQINPQFNLLLSQVEGSVPTINGDIKVSWSVEGKQLTMSVLVPKNTEATLRMPNVSQLNISHNGVAFGDSTLTPGLYQIEGLVE
jgi:alpha-L-rhamnosidase